MKKLILILLISLVYSVTGQNLQNPTYGTVTIKNSPTATSTGYLTSTGATGLQQKIDPSNITQFVTPEQYGAVGNGVADDKTAIQNAINSGKPVRLGFKSYYISGTINMPIRASLSGFGEGSLILTSGDYSAFNIVGAEVSIYNIGMLGAGKDSGLTNNNGIILTGNYPTTTNSSLTLNDLYIVGFSNAGIKQVGATSGAFRPSIVANNLNLGSNNIGVDIGVRGEYSSFSNCIISGNNVGVRMSGGNNNFVGGQIVSNGDGVYLLGGENDGHSVISGTAINHNTTSAIKSDGLTIGYLFDSCMIYGAVDINIKNSTGIKITNCDISIDNIRTANSSVEFLNIKWHTTPTFTDNYLSGGVSTIRYMNNYFKAGGQPTSIQSTFLEPVTIPRKLVVNTGTSGANLDIPNQANGTVEFSNASGANTVPTITGKSNDRTGLNFIAATNDVNANPDFQINFRKNDNSDFTTLTTPGFVVSRFGTTLMQMLRNGNTTFTGKVSAANATLSTDLATLGQVNALVRPYKVYTALLTQTGTSAPTATILENTLGGTVTLSRTGSGAYKLTLPSTVTPTKVGCFFSFGGNNSTNMSSAITIEAGGTYVQLATYNSGTQSDALMTTATVEIRVYN